MSGCVSLTGDAFCQKQELGHVRDVHGRYSLKQPTLFGKTAYKATKKARSLLTGQLDACRASCLVQIALCLVAISDNWKPKENKDHHDPSFNTVTRRCWPVVDLYLDRLLVFWILSLYRLYSSSKMWRCTN